MSILPAQTTEGLTDEGDNSNQRVCDEVTDLVCVRNVAVEGRETDHHQNNGIWKPKEHAEDDLVDTQEQADEITESRK